MTALVIDTNVLRVANGGPEYLMTCVRSCASALAKLQSGLIVIDDGFRLIREYKSHARESGQPGVGDAFLLWLLRNHRNPAVCELVPLAETTPGDFDAFPSDPDLWNFDRSDRKFVAVALTSKHGPRILNAVDSDWCLFLTALNRNGVTVEFLCPECMPKPECR